MEKLLFLLYYCKLRLSLLIGLHQTANPLNIKWRWRNWQYRYERRYSSRW